jgi:Asp-tRNA(Asn)/Glu-tRNA(Gln) amidotransferase A subunit family amidase
MDLVRMSAGEMAAAVRSKQLSPVDLVQAHLARIARLHPRINAFVQVDGEGAIERARAIERQVMRGEAAGPLTGVPVTVKSSVDVAGWRCPVGSRLRADYVAARDAPLVARLRGAGAIVLGNSNVPEMLMAYETDNLLQGRTSNPWDLTRTAGGSSGGEAAAIAAFCSAGGIGSDAGGSIRVPAHFCGICGLKPTPGRVPATGHFPPVMGPFARMGVVGPMARTAADVALLFEAIAGPSAGDVSAAPVPVRQIPDANLRGMRVGYFEDDDIVPVTPETRAAVAAAAKALAQAGFEVEAFRPEGLEGIRQLWWMFFGQVGGLLVRSMTDGRDADLSPTLGKYLDRVAEEPPLEPGRLVDAWMGRDVCRIRLEEEMGEFPILLCPVCAVPAFRHGAGGWTRDTVNYLDVMRYSQWFNLTGNPAASVPAGRSAEGLPIGVQIVGRLYEDELVLAVARKLEAAMGPRSAAPLD